MAVLFASYYIIERGFRKKWKEVQNLKIWWKELNLVFIGVKLFGNKISINKTWKKQKRRYLKADIIEKKILLLHNLKTNWHIDINRFTLTNPSSRRKIMGILLKEQYL